MYFNNKNDILFILALRKPPIKPSSPMRPLYWTRILAAPIPPTCQGEAEATGFKPLWLEIDEARIDNIDEFTDLFSRQVVKAPVKKKVEVKTKIQPIKILDSKRSQNVGILAQSLHVEFSEIENAIYNFDTSVVSLEALQQIYELVCHILSILFYIINILCRIKPTLDCIYDNSCIYIYFFKNMYPLVSIYLVLNVVFVMLTLTHVL